MSVKVQTASPPPCCWPLCVQGEGLEFDRGRRLEMVPGRNLCWYSTSLALWVFVSAVILFLLVIFVWQRAAGGKEMFMKATERKRKTPKLYTQRSIGRRTRWMVVLWCACSFHCEVKMKWKKLMAVWLKWALQLLFWLFVFLWAHASTHSFASVLNRKMFLLHQLCLLFCGGVVWFCRCSSNQWVVGYVKAVGVWVGGVEGRLRYIC